MPSYEPTDEELATMQREVNEEEALEWRKLQGRDSSQEIRYREKRERERAADYDHNHRWEISW
jgi:hypothetical protein